MTLINREEPSIRSGDPCVAWLGPIIEIEYICYNHLVDLFAICQPKRGPHTLWKSVVVKMPSDDSEHEAEWTVGGYSTFHSFPISLHSFLLPASSSVPSCSFSSLWRVLCPDCGPPSSLHIIPGQSPWDWHHPGRVEGGNGLWMVYLPFPHGMTVKRATVQDQGSQYPQEVLRS